ncbi:MAG TPA: amidohydrolase, partial [Thermoanaerobaculia bacterium]
MIRRTFLVLAAVMAIAVAAFAAGVLWPVDRLEAVRTREPLAITGVTVVDVRSGTLLPDRTVVVEQGRIRAIGTTVPLPDATRVIDGRGKYLLPALWDMHAHVFAISPLLDLPLYLAFGVTNVRDMQGCPNAGDPFIACPEDKR